IKPTFGRVSRRGMAPFSFSHDHVGIIAHTMDDVALVLSVIAGPDPLETTTLQEPAPPGKLLPERVTPPRIGRVRNFFPDFLEPVMPDAIEYAATTMSRAGATVLDVELPKEFSLLWHTHMLVSLVESSPLAAPRLAKALESGVSPDRFDGH